MKQLKDYLHLYLGCKCYYGRTHYAGKLIGVERNGAVTWDITNGRAVWDLKKLLPILRPLSSMTEIEERSYYEIKGKNSFNLFECESALYLLSRQFDVFNLIEEGLAIDATTV